MSGLCSDPKPVHVQLPWSRTCSDGTATCTACCKGPSIDEPSIEKPLGAACRHLEQNGKGCGIYAHRPRVCKRFLCGWLQGGDTERPDRCGVLYWFFTMRGVGRTLLLLEIKEGALNREDVIRYYDRECSEGWAALLVPMFGNVTLRLPRRLMLMQQLAEPTFEDGRHIHLVHL